MTESLESKYRTALHEALLVKIKTRNTAAAADGFIIVEDEILQELVNSRDLANVKKQLYNQVYIFKAAEIVDTEQQANETKDLHQSYIKLGLFLAILNKYLLTADTDIFQFDLVTPGNKYRTIDGHLSVDPQVCLLPGTLQSLIDKQDGLDDPLVYNLYLNVDFVTKVLDGFLDSQANVLLLDFFEDLFSEIERVTGNINKYELQYYEQTNSFTVLDRNFLSNEPKTSFPEIDVYGLRSVITNLNLVSQISSKMSSMVAISAQDSPFSSNMESTGFAALNKDLVNRQEGKVKDLSKEELLEIKEQKELTYDELLKKFETDMGQFLTHLNAVYGLKIFNLSDSYYISSIYENYCNMVIGKKNDPTYSFIIPFQLNLTLDGISGVKVLNSFRINKNILPSTYGGRTGTDVAFLITGVEHSIDAKAWTTNLRTQIYNVNDKGVINGGKNYRAYWPTLATPSIVSGGTSTITGAYSMRADNNPFNIRPIGSATNFNGVVGQKQAFRGSTSIGTFLVFDNLNNGVRAGMKNLVNSYFNRGIDNINDIITKYAPPSDNNNTADYIANVRSRMQTALAGTKYAKLNSTTPLTFKGAKETDPENIKMFKALCNAILVSEGGSFAKSVVDLFDITKLA
jgi:hypothetical protein